MFAYLPVIAVLLLVNAEFTQAINGGAGAPTRSPTKKPTANPTATISIVSTIAGNGQCGYQDGVGTVAEFCYPAGITNGGCTDDVSSVVSCFPSSIYVADQGNHVIREILNDGLASAPSWLVTTTVGIAHTPGTTDGGTGVGQLSCPLDVALHQFACSPLDDYGLSSYPTGGLACGSDSSTVAVLYIADANCAGTGGSLRIFFKSQVWLATLTGVPAATSVTADGTTSYYVAISRQAGAYSFEDVLGRGDTRFPKYLTYESKSDYVKSPSGVIVVDPTIFANSLVGADGNTSLAGQVLFWNDRSQAFTQFGTDHESPMNIDYVQWSSGGTGYITFVIADNQYDRIKLQTYTIADGIHVNVRFVYCSSVLRLVKPRGVVGGNTNIYFSSTFNDQILYVPGSTWQASVLASSSNSGIIACSAYTANTKDTPTEKDVDQSVTSAYFYRPWGMTIVKDSSGNTGNLMFVVDNGGHSVRLIHDYTMTTGF